MFSKDQLSHNQEKELRDKYRKENNELKNKHSREKGKLRKDHLRGKKTQIELKKKEPKKLNEKVKLHVQ